MATPGSIIQLMLSRPIQHLVMKRNRLPNIEVIRLYREVYKFASKFQWYNDKGQFWQDILRRSARKEFDLSKSQNDPFLIMKMMVTTRECMSQIDNKLVDAQVAFVKTVDQTKNGQEEHFMRSKQ